MNKREFLEILRESLKGEVSLEDIEQNIRYYDQYISAQTTAEEEKTLGELGDPRLIARTIIESDKAAKQKVKYTSQGNYTNYNSQEDNSQDNREKSNHNRNIFFTNVKWYHKIMVALVVILVIILIAFIGRILIGFLFAFGLPIILLLFVMALFRKR